MANTLINLTDRDYDSLLADMVAAMPSLAPTWTNASTGDPGQMLLSLIAGVGDMLSWYIDRTAEECFLPTARTLDAMRRLCALIDYRLSRPVAATTTIRFTLSAPAGSNVTIPKYTVVQTASGILFATAQDAVIFTGQSTVTVTANQGRLVTDAFTGTGLDPQDFTLSTPDVAQNFLVVSVSSALWQEDSRDAPFTTAGIYDVNTDLNGNATLHFAASFGTAPSANAPISATYLSTLGSAGNVGTGLVNTLITAIAGQTSVVVTNTVPATGGTDKESIEAARANAPRALRTLNRAVTLQDYMDLVDAHSGFVQSQAINHSGYVELYAAPSLGTALYVKHPAVSLAAASGGSLAATTYYVRVTVVDAYGETTSWDYNPADRAVVDNLASQAATSSQKIVVTITRVPGAVSYNVYMGTSSGTQYFASNTADPGSGTTFNVNVLTCPVSGANPPVKNTTGLRSADGVACLRQDLETYLEQRRTLCTTFALFNPVYVPVPITATVYLYANYRQSDVQNRVQAALATALSFANQTFATTVPLSSLVLAAMQVAGVQNIAFSLPSGDTTISNGQIATLGTVTLTMSGGVV